MTQSGIAKPKEVLTFCTQIMQDKKEKTENRLEASNIIANYYRTALKIKAHQNN